MRVKIKRTIIIMFIAAYIVLIAAGCGGDSSDKEKEVIGENSTSQNSSSNEGLLEFEFFRNYAWDVGRYPFDETNLISKWIIENKKVKVNFTWPSGGNPNEKLNIMVATDSLPEVIMISRDQTWTSLISKDGTKDKVIPLDHYYEKYEGYRTNVSKEVVDFTRINGKIYGILNWPKNKEWKGYGSGMILNDELYKQLGSPKLDTLDQFYDYLKLVKSNTQGIIPLQPGAGELTFGMIWSCYGEERVPVETYGIMLRPIDGKLRHVINDPKFPDFISYLRKLYKEGLISQEYAIEMPEPVKDKLKRQKVAVYMAISAIDDADNARSILEAAGRTNPYEAYELPAAPGVDKNSIVTGTSSMVGWNVICLTNNAKMDNGKVNMRKEERIYEYLDWVFLRKGSGFYYAVRKAFYGRVPMKMDIRFLSLANQ